MRVWCKPHSRTQCQSMPAMPGEITTRYIRSDWSQLSNRQVNTFNRHLFAGHGAVLPKYRVLQRNHFTIYLWCWRILFDDASKLFTFLPDSWPACRLWHCSSSTNEKLNMWRMHIWLILKSCCLVNFPIDKSTRLIDTCLPDMGLCCQSRVLQRNYFRMHIPRSEGRECWHGDGPVRPINWPSMTEPFLCFVIFPTSV